MLLGAGMLHLGVPFGYNYLLIQQRDLMHLPRKASVKLLAVRALNGAMEPSIAVTAGCVCINKIGSPND
jgi:hypothetical protein